MAMRRKGFIAYNSRHRIFFRSFGENNCHGATFSLFAQRMLYWKLIKWKYTFISSQVVAEWASSVE